jgi:PKD repeat protein
MFKLVEKSWQSTFLFLLVMGISSINCKVANADAVSDWTTLGCQGCHGNYSSMNVSSYTFADLKRKIQDEMPKNNPTACGSGCASNIAYLLKPVAALTQPSENLVGVAPLTSTFYGGASTCIGAPCTFTWNFNDGTPPVNNPPGQSDYRMNHTFTTPGRYKVTLTVTNSLGQSDVSTLYAYVVTPESLSNYVTSCKSQLSFNDNDIPNDLNCANAQLFARNGAGSAVNDYMDYRRITDKVDMVFACRWLQNGTGVNEVSQGPFMMAASVEMFMHNRENGNTCFFRAKEQPIPIPAGGTRNGVSVNIVSPTVAANAAPGSAAALFWDQPAELAASLPCVDCHVSGPVIASPRIAPTLAKFGLLNNGHDTFGRTLANNGSTSGKYHAVGTTLDFFNHLSAFNNFQSNCAAGCHAVGYYSTADSVLAARPPGTGGAGVDILLPSLSFDVIGGSDPKESVEAAGVMPANNPANGDDPTVAAYTWINRDTSYSGSNDSDIETFSAAKNAFPTLLNYCGKPNYMLAHAVGSDLDFRPGELPDNLKTFNAKEGLTCVNSEQSDGTCEDYSIQYQCTAPNGTVSWTGVNNIDTPAGNWQGAGDHELKAQHPNVCIAPAKTTGIKATFTLRANGWTYSAYGPMDRLAKFDKYGLVCNNTDQTDGQCSNYVVKFGGCSDASADYNAKIQSAWSGGILTAAGTGNDADVRVQPQTGGWDTQGWVVKAVADTDYVRLQNTKTGRYLNAQNNSNFADVVLYDYVDDWKSQQWIVESISGSSSVRLKNVWSGYYLTVTNNGTYGDLKAQPLDPNWPSQRWNIQK